MLNIKGIVKIGGALKIFKNLDEVNENINNTLKAGTGYPYCSSKTSTRKFYARLTSSGSNLYIYFTAQKKFLWGWISYRTKYYYKATQIQNWHGPVLNVTYSTGELPSGSYVYIGVNDSGSPIVGTIETWSRGVGYSNKCDLFFLWE